MVFNSNQKSKLSEKQYGPYVVRNDQIYFIDSETKKELYIADLVYIKCVKQNFKTNQVTLTLRYKYFGKWKEIEVLRNEISARKIQDLSTYGVAVNSYNAKDIERFLVLQEQKAPYAYSYSNLGWCEVDEQLVFAHHGFIGMQTENIIGEYVGNYHLQETGNIEAYHQLLEEYVFGHTPLEFAFALAFASPIISLMSIGKSHVNLLVHIYGESGQGKTTATKLIASVFGKPAITSDGLINSWNASDKSLVTQLGETHGVPMFLDEASMKDKKFEFSKTIYQLAQGQDMQRLNPDLTKMHRNSWSGVLVSTAEHSLFEKSSKNSGLKVRVLELGYVKWTKSAEHARAINDLAEKNYGWLAKPFIEFLQQQELKNIKKRYEDLRTRLLEVLPKKDSFTERVMDDLVYVLLAAEYANKCFNFTIDIDAIQSFIIENELKTMGNRNRAETAYQYIQSKIVQNDHKVIDVTTNHLSNGETIGKKTNKDIAILKIVVDKWLEEAGYNDTQGVMTEVKQAGYVMAESGRNTRKRKLHDEEVIVYVFNKVAD